MRWTTVGAPSIVWRACARPGRAANVPTPERARHLAAEPLDGRASDHLDTDGPRPEARDRAVGDDAPGTPLRPRHVDRI